MSSNTNEKIIAYLTLVSGLSISAVAVYYSVVGLTAIFAAAFIPIIVMGVTLEVSKLVATIWLKQNWTLAPWSIRAYLLTAILILMLITSMGIFGFLSKSHSDQTLVSGDFQSKIAIYDEKIKTAKENIEADRRQLKQMDEAVDQVMARSTTEEGASRSNAIRKTQARDRSALAKNIETNQKLIAAINEEAAPLRAEIRKVEAEVGPLKYIAQFIYGETDKTVLEKAVTWVIILIVIVFDPLAVVLLLASQISFQNFRERANAKYEPDNGPLTQDQIKESTEDDSPEKESDVVNTATVTGPLPTIIETSMDDFDISKHPYLFKAPETRHPPGIEPVGPQVYKENVEPVVQQHQELIVEESVHSIETTSFTELELKARELQENVKNFGYSSENNIVKVAGKDYSKEEFDKLMAMPYNQNENLTAITQEEYIKAIKEKQNKE